MLDTRVFRLLFTQEFIGNGRVQWNRFSQKRFGTGEKLVLVAVAIQGTCTTSGSIVKSKNRELRPNETCTESKMLNELSQRKFV